MKTTIRIFNLLFCVLFIVSAALQYNDPDPYIWIPIYLYGALLSWLAFRQKFYPKAFLYGSIVFALYAVYLFFEDDGVADWLSQHEAENIAASMQATKPWIEATREFFGLFILIIVFLVNYFYAKRRRIRP
jgi:hypothetical protein